MRFSRNSKNKFQNLSFLRVAQQQVSGFLKNLIPTENEKNSFCQIIFDLLGIKSEISD